jgi:hypothetical protein
MEFKKKSIRTIYRWLATDLRKNVFSEFFASEKWKSCLFVVFLKCFERFGAKSAHSSFFLSLSLSSLSTMTRYTAVECGKVCVIQSLLEHLTIIIELCHEVYHKSDSILVSWLVQVYYIWHLIFVGWLLHISFQPFALFRLLIYDVFRH